MEAKIVSVTNNAGQGCTLQVRKCGSADTPDVSGTLQVMNLPPGAVAELPEVGDLVQFRFVRQAKAGAASAGSAAGGKGGGDKGGGDKGGGPDPAKAKK